MDLNLRAFRGRRTGGAVTYVAVIRRLLGGSAGRRARSRSSASSLMAFNQDDD